MGTNSLLDIIVFGRRSGIAAAEYALTATQHELPENPTALVEAELQAMLQRPTGESVAQLRQELQETMDRNAQVFRTEESLTEALQTIRELQTRYGNVSVQDKSKVFNTDLLEAFELGFLLDLAEVVALGALRRNESRGGHFREDYPNRDDENFMSHTMAYRRLLPGDDQVDAAGIPAHQITLDTKPVVFTRYEPMERKY